jgi:periplasmic protein TonB
MNMQRHGLGAILAFISILLVVCGWFGTRVYLNRRDTVSAPQETAAEIATPSPGTELPSPSPDRHPELPMIVQQPEPPPPTPQTRSMPRVDPSHPLKVGQEFYPAASKRKHEEGRCVVQVTVATDGLITHSTLQKSSGFEDLDKACLDAVIGGRMLPAIKDGRAVEDTGAVPISWKLAHDHTT